MASLKQKQIDAAQEFVSATVNALKTDRGLHAETAIAATARMAGTFLFRSFGFSIEGIEPGQVVLSGLANEQGPRLIEVLSGVLSHVGVSLNEEEKGGTPGPENQPHQGFLETQKHLEPLYVAIKNRHHLSAKEAAESGAVAAALLIRQCSQVLDLNVAFEIAVYAIIEGTKTAPDPVVL
ncbi:MAG: hypothetical protein ACM3KE_14445 [Hyphomicrobiales bacterium]